MYVTRGAVAVAGHCSSSSSSAWCCAAWSLFLLSRSLSTAAPCHCRCRIRTCRVWPEPEVNWPRRSVADLPTSSCCRCQPVLGGRSVEGWRISMGGPLRPGCRWTIESPFCFWTQRQWWHPITALSTQVVTVDCVPKNTSLLHCQTKSPSVERIPLPAEAKNHPKFA